MNFDALQRGCRTLTDSVATLIKIPLMSGRPSPAAPVKEGTVIVMGNGPSLRDVMVNYREVLMRHPRLAVNFSALTPEIRALKPQYYLLADIAFFQKVKTGRVPELWASLAEIDWEMTLFLPTTAKGMAEVKRLPVNITVKWYNLTPAEGWEPLIHAIYRSGLAMPRPRNVLVPAIMCIMREGFRKIALIGADHNWSRTLSVTENNRVVAIQPHFYKQNEKDLKAAEEVFKNVHIHDIYGHYAVAFKSYHDIRRYADKNGVEIINCTSGSFIDAFVRRHISSLKN